MELQLINQEICESRLYRTTASLSKLDGRDVANLVYLNTLATYLMLQDDQKYDFAQEYAKKTAQYGSYNNFKTVGTDLYMLCYILNNVDNNEVTLKNHVSSTKFLRTLQFDSRRHTIFIRSMAREEDKKSLATSFFLRLESQLKIKESNYKQYRRDIANWRDLKDSIKHRVIKMFIMDIRKIAMIGEVLIPLNSMLSPKPKTEAVAESATQDISEIFDSPYPIEDPQRNDYGDYVAHTKLPDGSALVITFENYGDLKYDVEFSKNFSYAVSDEGDAYKIFATVLGNIITFIKDVRPEEISFVADKNSHPAKADGYHRLQLDGPDGRTKLYDRMVKKYADELGYKLNRTDQPSEVIYVLQRSR